MEAQLDFAWEAEHVTWKPNPVPQPSAEYYELPDQLDFKLAEPPQITSELPAPLAFVNDKGKKLIQFNGLPKKPKPKGLGKQKPKPVLAKKTEKILEIKEKPEWNNKVETIGLFDPKLSKKIPIEIKHAIKKENFNNIKRPEVFNDIQEIDFSKSNKPNLIKNQGGKKPKIEENLEIKFIADQEELVKKLEKQLENEKLARKRLDEQFSEKLKEIEKIGKKGKSVQFVGNSYGKPKDPEKNQNFTQAVRPITNFAFEEKTRTLPSEGPKHDVKGGYIHEPPTHDISPMVLKAQKPTKPDKKTGIQKSAAKPLGSGKLPENQKNSEIFKNPENPQKLEFKELNIQPYLPAKNSVKFEVFDIPKSDPILTTLNAAITKYKTAEKYSGHSGVGLISKISSKYIAYYANELTDMMLNDFLEDCVVDLQKVEENKAKVVSLEFQKEAENNFETIVKDFYEETEKLKSKYVGKKIIKKNQSFEEENVIVIEDKKRDWEIFLNDNELASIRHYRKVFQDFQKIIAGGSDGKLWDVYSYIGDDILDEVIKDVAGEYDTMLDEFTERMISQEFS